MVVWYSLYQSIYQLMIDVVEEKVVGLRVSVKTAPCMMPYITAFFMPRKGDRPNVVPDGAVNFAFLGQFAETQFITEYSIRTGMEAVYMLLDIDRGVPEVWGSTYNVRDLLHATVALRDDKAVTDMKLNFFEKFILK